MTIFGIIIFIILGVALSIFLGPYGGLILISIIFGLVFSTHQRSKKIHEDLQLIKEKLGIEDKRDLQVPNEEIENELEREFFNDENKKLSEIDKEIEKELEEYIDNNDKDRK